jgi:hypothetical protein
MGRYGEIIIPSHPVTLSPSLVQLTTLVQLFYCSIMDEEDAEKFHGLLYLFFNLLLAHQRRACPPPTTDRTIASATR